MTLREEVEQEIRKCGPIPFSRYMELCLYHPQLGYYSRQSEQFGRAGDFYTASDVHAVFGRLLARQFEEMWRALDSPERLEIVELGPGRGLFAHDVLDWSAKKFPAFFSTLHYSLVEQSACLREHIQQTLNKYIRGGKVSVASDSHDAQPGTAPPTAGTTVTGTTEFETVPMVSAAQIFPVASSVAAEHTAIPRCLRAESPALIFANEFFDALPVEVLSSQGKLRIAVDKNHLVEQWSPASQEELAFLDRYGVHPEPGERIEVPLLAERYMQRIAATIERGFAVVVDYGYSRDEQLRGRHRNTLRAFRQHSMSPNPYQAPGEQDITAHVNFTALAAAAEHGGMRPQPPLTQSQFLMGIGEQNQFADAFEDCQLPQERAKVALQLKHLVTPAGMGESFQVLIASKGVDADLTPKLSGLSFGVRDR